MPRLGGRIGDRGPEAGLPRAIKVAVFAALTGFAIAAVLLAATAWRGLRRIEPLHAQLTRLQQLQATALRVEEALVARFGEREVEDVPDLASLHSRILEILGSGQFLDPDTPTTLRDAADALARLDPDDPNAIIALLEDFRRALQQETLAFQSLTDRLRANTALEFQIAVGLFLALPAITLLLIVMLRFRILRPLDDLRRLMATLGKPEYHTVPVAGVMPPLRPVFENYNAMVERLSELESHHRARQRSLEREVHEATSALLRQEHELAEAERLAAVGEIAASVAHELRNPLAGIQVALSGLRSDLQDREAIQRLDLVLAELRRTVRLLNDLLDHARPTSESAVDIDLGKTVTELLALVRFRLPQRIELEHNIQQDLHWEVPDGRLRQALLNLILNAARALGNDSGSIRVDAEVVGDRLRLRVTDDGPGFPDELLESGVQSFVTWRKKGTGLGLATVQRFVRESGGRMCLENREPRGAVVTIELPRGGAHG